MVIHEFPDSRLNGGEIIVRVADYIVKRLMEYGVQHVFMIPGGGAMHLNDAVGRRALNTSVIITSRLVPLPQKDTPVLQEN